MATRFDTRTGSFRDYRNWIGKKLTNVPVRKAYSISGKIIRVAPKSFAMLATDGRTWRSISWSWYFRHAGKGRTSTKVTSKVRVGDTVRVNRPRKPFLIKVARVNVKTFSGRDERGRNWRISYGYSFTVVKGKAAATTRTTKTRASKAAPRSAPKTGKNQRIEFARRVNEIAAGIPDSFKPKRHFMEGAKVTSKNGVISAAAGPRQQAAFDSGNAGYNGWAYAALPGMSRRHGGVFIRTDLLSAKFMKELSRRIRAEFPQATVWDVLD